MTTKEYELEALRQLQALTKTITSAMMLFRFQEWVEEPGGVDRLHDWFMQYPQWYNTDHAIRPKTNNTEEIKYDRTTEAGLN